MRTFFVATIQYGRYAHKVPFGAFLAIACVLGLSTFPAYTQEQPSADGDLGIPATAVGAAAELKAEEQQRILGVMPNFNTTNLHNAAPLSKEQKFQLALKGAVDPFAFVAAGLDAGLGQWEKDTPGYGYGATGYAQRVEAAYLDAFDGAIMGDALLPSLLHQDPRYFRQGVGSFGSRFMHAIASAYRCKDDDGRWTWNYSNLLGNLAAGGIANAYYAPSDRGRAHVRTRIHSNGRGRSWRSVL